MVQNSILNSVLSETQSHMWYIFSANFHLTSLFYRAIIRNRLTYYTHKKDLFILKTRWVLVLIKSMHAPWRYDKNSYTHHINPTIDGLRSLRSFSLVKLICTRLQWSLTSEFPLIWEFQNFKNWWMKISKRYWNSGYRLRTQNQSNEGLRRIFIK